MKEKEFKLSDKIVRNSVDLRMYKDPYYLEIEDVKKKIQNVYRRLKEELKYEFNPLIFEKKINKIFLEEIGSKLLEKKE